MHVERFKYLRNADDQLTDILGSTFEFEDLILQVSPSIDILDVSVTPLTSGLSGAAVFLVRRVTAQGSMIPWVVKAAKDAKLITAERNNYVELVRDRISAVPNLVGIHSSKLLIFEFGGFLGEYNLQTLREGYASATAESLATLMERLVRSLHPLHRLSDDSVHSIERMQFIPPLSERLPQLGTTKLTADVAETLITVWNSATSRPHPSTRKRSTGHGDLNTGNILFAPGNDASYPIIIDFASMRNNGDPYHPVFWDYAKVERDIKTRLFLKEALSDNLEESLIIDAVWAVDIGVKKPISAKPPVVKLWATIKALRESIQQQYAPSIFDHNYWLTVAYATLHIFYRKQPDTDLDLKIQYLVTAKSATALLSGSDARTASGPEILTTQNSPNSFAVHTSPLSRPLSNRTDFAEDDIGTKLIDAMNMSEKLFNDGKTLQSFRVSKKFMDVAARHIRQGRRVNDLCHALIWQLLLIATRAASYICDGGGRLLKLLGDETIEDLLSRKIISSDYQVALKVELISVNQGFRNYGISAELCQTLTGRNNELTLKKLGSRKILARLWGQEPPDDTEVKDLLGSSFGDNKHVIRLGLIRSWSAIARGDTADGFEIIKEVIAEIDENGTSNCAQKYDPMIELEARLTLKSLIGNQISDNSASRDNEYKIKDLYERFKHHPIILRPSIFDLIGVFGKVHRNSITLIEKDYITHNPKFSQNVTNTGLVLAQLTKTLVNHMESA